MNVMTVTYAIKFVVWFVLTSARNAASIFGALRAVSVFPPPPLDLVGEDAQGMWAKLERLPCDGEDKKIFDLCARRQTNQQSRGIRAGSENKNGTTLIENVKHHTALQIIWNLA